MKQIIYLLVFLVAVCSVIADTEITGCMDITIPDRYYFAGDVAGTIGARDNCIDIQSTGVVIDCQHFTLTTDEVPPVSYIHNGPYANNVIANCNIATGGASVTTVNTVSYPAMGSIENLADIYGDYMYMTGYYGLASFNISDPANPTPLAIRDNYVNMDFHISHNDSHGDLIAVGLGRGGTNYGFATYNLSFDNETYGMEDPYLLEWRNCSLLSDEYCYYGGGKKLFLDKDRRIAFEKGISLYTWNYSDPVNLPISPSYIGYNFNLDLVTDMDFVKTNTNYVAFINPYRGFGVFLKSNPQTNVLVNSARLPDSTKLEYFAIITEGDLVYIDGTRGFVVYNVSVPFSPVLVSIIKYNSTDVWHVNELSKVPKMVKHGDYIYAKTGGVGIMSVIEVSNPNKPKVVYEEYIGPTRSAYLPTRYSTLFVDPYIYMTSDPDNAEFKVFDIDNVRLGTGILSDVGDVIIANNTIIGDGEYGIRIDAIADTSSLIITKNNVTLNSGAAFTYNARNCPTNISLYDNNLIGTEKLYGQVTCAGGSINLSSYYAYGNYYGPCTDDNLDGFCDSEYSELFNSTWYDSFALANEITMTEICIPEWTCSNYAVCQPNGVQQCLGITDYNECEVQYGGQLADFDRSCTYNGGGSGSGTDAGTEQATEPVAAEIPISLPATQTNWRIAYEDFKFMFAQILQFGLTRETIETIKSTISEHLMIVGAFVIVLAAIIYSTRKKKGGKRRRR
jgi:hypothetical protein